MPLPSNSNNQSFTLKKIFLRNFKSIKKTEVAVSPLTIIVGANSSGKSSLLQSVLSIQQAMSKELNGVDFPLNGEIIRLGTFAETKSFFAQGSSEPVQIGFEIETDRSSLRSWDGDLGRMVRSARRESKYRANFTFDLVKSESEESGTARVGHILIESNSKNESRSRTSNQVLKLDLSFDSDPGRDNLERFRFCTGSLSHSNKNQRYSLSAAEFSGLIPTTLYEKGDQASYAAEEVFKSIRKLFAKDLEKVRVQGHTLLMKDKEILDLEESAVEILSLIFADLAENFELNVDVEGIPSRNVIDENKKLDTEIQKLNAESKKILVKLVAVSNKERLAKEFDRSAGVPFLKSGTELQPLGEDVHNTMDDLNLLVKQIFRGNINYLAPIRLNPKVNYDPSSGRPDVGPGGEYTAYVLHTFGSRPSSHPLPNGATESVSLNHAVNSWLEFFGLAKEAKTVDNGRLGIGLRLNLLSGGHEVDLTSVGVGVSQVLPVLVSCLTAKRGAILLIEQPELHLHPKLQMDLADFLISCCQFGKQIIVETHSEHIVNRIRRRIAEADNGELESLIGVLFAEQSKGVTQYRSPSINKFGGLGSDWPDGFLDIGAGEMENLLGAGLNKRKKI